MLSAAPGSVASLAEEKVKLTRQKLQHARRVLHARDPHCHWCGVVTIDPRKTLDLKRPDLATLDHVKSRLQCSSKEEYRSGNNHVIACLKCNGERDRELHLKERPWEAEARKFAHSLRVWNAPEGVDVFAKPSWEMLAVNQAPT